MYSELLKADGFGGLHRLVKSALDSLGPPEYTQPPQPDYFLLLAAAYSAGAGIKSRGFISILTQLARFDWISPSKATECVNRLESAVCMDSFVQQFSNQPLINNYNVAVMKANYVVFERSLRLLLNPDESTHMYPVSLVGKIADGFHLFD